MILNVSNLNKAYLDKPILRDVSFHLEDKEKAAIVGINGSGKTTILRCILGEEDADSGLITLAKGKKLAYLAQQHADISHGDPAYDILSGGQKTRMRLEAILAEKPDLLILDEPTNHLDIVSIQWLEKVLKRYEGAVLLVSHDRYFLDVIVRKIIDLENGKARVYKGNYSEYAEKKRQIRDSERKAYFRQQEEIRRQEAVIQKLKQFNREKSIKRAESREKMLAKIERLEKPQEIDNEMRLALSPNVRSGSDVLSVKDLAKSYGEKSLFSHAQFSIRRGEHVAIIGQNGSGKTTMLKILTQMEEADAGEFRLGTNVHIGYYDQEHAVLHTDKTIFEEIQDDYPQLDNGKVRSVLAAFLFTGDEVYKRIGSLSGGEQGRVSLAKLMLSDANFLLLDEPTNHLDIQGKEVLEDAIRNYEGTLLYVSHDRYFINKTASRILELYEGRFDNYIGNYDYYLEKREDVRRASGSGERNAAGLGRGAASGQGGRRAELPAAHEKASQARQDWERQKESQAAIRKQENLQKRAEAEIQALEEKKERLEREMQDPETASDAEKLMELHQQHEEAEARLAEQYEIWENAAEELEKLLAARDFANI